MITFDGKYLLWEGSNNISVCIGMKDRTEHTDTNLFRAKLTFRNILSSPNTLQCIYNGMDNDYWGRNLDVFILKEIVDYFYTPNFGQESHIEYDKFRNELFMEIVNKLQE
jgi:hypothetical protein